MRSSWPRCSTAPASTSTRRLFEYQAERSLEVLKLQNSARNSTEWFETLDRYLHFEPLQFAYSLLTRSQRISHENLRLRDKDWLEGVERWFWERAGVPDKSAAPMFAPFKLRELELANRITVSPMAMYSAVDGMPNDFHLVHYGERAIGGAGLLFTEMTCVSPEGRITPGCTGMWNDDHVRRVDQDRRFRPCEQRRRKSASSSAIRAPRVRPGSAGKAMTCPWTRAIGR